MFLKGIKMPNFDIENHIITTTNNKIIAGVDEVGRGPWAGPVTTCAVIINQNTFPKELASQLDDSKKLSDKKRELLFPQIIENVTYHIGECTVEEVDEHNILQATMIAMTRAVNGLSLKPDYVLVDGNRMPPASSGWTYDGEPIIKGDAKSITIAAASIIAKVTRDRTMKQLATEYPHYGWDSNAGYGTKAHQDGIAQHGICQHHRKSFAPIKKLLG